MKSATDPLTGLANRSTFDDRLEAEFGRTRGTGQPLSLIIMDIDQFKTFNDQFGHSAGDAALRIVARTLRERSRSSDVVARFGGEEFTVILPNTDLQGALILAERFRSAIENSRWDRRPVTVSVGVAEATESVAGPADLVDRADGALYEAKRRGRNRVIETHPSFKWNPVGTSPRTRPDRSAM